MNHRLTKWQRRWSRGGAETAAGSDGWAHVETDDDGQDGRDSGEEYTGPIDEKFCVASSCDVSTAAVALTPKEAHQTPAPLDLRPITVTCLLYNLCHGHLVLTSSGGATCGYPSLHVGDIPEHRTRECVWTVVLAVEAKEEGVATAAIDSSTFFDVMAWEVVFSMMGKMRGPGRVWKLHGTFVFHLNVSVVNRNLVEKCEEL